MMDPDDISEHPPLSSPPGERRGQTAPPSFCDPKALWVVSDGRRGIENQALGLAEALVRHLPLHIHPVHLHPGSPQVWLPARLWPAPNAALPQKQRLHPPWPALWIACGRKSLPYSLAVKRWSGGKTFTIQIQDPKMNPAFFDGVVPPEHDGLSGENVFPIIGSPNRITPKALVKAHAQFHNDLKNFPKPHTAVLIGGQAKRWHLTPDMADDHVKRLEKLLNKGGSLLITPSRRTPQFMLHKLERLKAHPHVWLWQGEGDNPYLAFLASADLILVTQDSTNMLTEACSTGTPVMMLAMQSQNPGKFTKLYDRLKTRCGIRFFEGKEESWSYPPLQETERIAKSLSKTYNTFQNMCP